MCGRRETGRERGLTLLEQILFIVIIGIAAAGIVSVIGYATRASVDPMIQKQALSIAEALLEEAQLMPFTYCDPDDPNAAGADSAAACATAEGIGAEGGESRTVGPLYFDNVSDYHGLAVSPVSDIAGNAIAGLSGYAATITVANQGYGGVPAADALLITVTVTHPNLDPSISLHGYRVRYAPNALP
jgi:MSHA pilin protein MshD